MNSARPAGAIPAEPLRGIFDPGRSGLFACAGVLAALNVQATKILAAFSIDNSLAVISDLAGISGVIWFAMYSALRIGLEGNEARAISRDRFVVGAAVLLSILPIAITAKAALELIALYALATSKADQGSRRVAIVLLGLTGPLIWGPIILDSFAVPVLSVDAHLVGAAIGTNVQGNIVQFANSQRQFLIGVGCSSVHNISLAIVLWTTAAALFRVRIDGRYIAWGLSMVGFMFGLNVIRLSAIGRFPDSFVFLHDGVGAGLFGWAALVGAGLIALVGVGSAVARQQ